MALSFTLATPGQLKTSPLPVRRSVLVTGAAGNIGSYFAEHAATRYDLTLMVRSEEERHRLQYYGKTVVQDLGDLAGLTRCCAGVDTVLHLAAAASPSSTWDEILSANIVGTYHLMVAAKAAGCRRVIYASSIHAVSGYPKETQVKEVDPVNPGDLYGVSKCFGEALSRYMAEQEGLSVIALRIGGFQPVEEAKTETGLSMLDAFVTRRDLQQLLEKCIDDTSLRFGLFHALSGNRFLRLDIASARELLGYAPVDDTTELHPALKGLDLDEKVVAHNKSDEASGYESGIREELQEARGATGAVVAGDGRAAGKAKNGIKAAAPAASKKSSLGKEKEKPMAGKPSKEPNGKKAPGGTKRATKPSVRQTPANPADFGKSTSPVRERMAEALEKTPPEERLKRGR
jgi:NAD(P)-dependent dehydrogenase (short-subunit alcohol dehydrogenase family)